MEAQLVEFQKVASILPVVPAKGTWTSKDDEKPADNPTNVGADDIAEVPIYSVAREEQLLIMDVPIEDEDEFIEGKDRAVSETQ